MPGFSPSDAARIMQARADRDALLAEAAQLCAFAARQPCDIILGEP